MPNAIKKHPNKNEYCLTNNGLWIRNYTKTAKPIDINYLTDPSDYALMTANELSNKTLNIPDIGSETFHFEHCIIISNGYDFSKVQHVLNEIPKNVCILGTNRTLAKWKDDNGNLLRRQMNFFVVNNPYADAIGLLPKHKYLPRCIVSNRTNHTFVQKYKGVLYRYVPVYDRHYAGESGVTYQIDDYRNPICAAIGLAYRFSVEKLLLLCCDDSFDTQRPGSECLENGFWMYPQHQVAHDAIEGNLYWLQKQEAPIKIGDCSRGPYYQSVPYIELSDIMDFFQND